MQTQIKCVAIVYILNYYSHIGGTKRPHTEDKKMNKLINSAPYDLAMSKEQFSDFWARNHNMVIYRVNGSGAIPAQNFKAKFAKARGISTADAFIQALLTECNKENRTIAEYINTHYDRVVLGQ